MPPKPERIRVTPKRPRTRPYFLAKKRGNNKKFRKQVLQRDNYTCVDCGEAYPEYNLHADHVIPLSDGGCNNISNGATRCIDCHNKKTQQENIERNSLES